MSKKNMAKIITISDFKVWHSGTVIKTAWNWHQADIEINETIKVANAREKDGWLRALFVLVDDPCSVLSTLWILQPCVTPITGGHNALFWLSLAQGMHVAAIHTFRQILIHIKHFFKNKNIEYRYKSIQL